VRYRVAHYRGNSTREGDVDHKLPGALTAVVIVALSSATRLADLQGIDVWVAVFATTVTLLLVILLGAAG
jgi:hypothetical protein